MATMATLTPPKTPVTHPWRSIRVLCRRGLRGYDSNGRPDWMIAPGTWLGVESVSEETHWLHGERKTMYYLAPLPGHDLNRVKYRACTSSLYESDDLWELWRVEDTAVVGLSGPVGVYSEGDVKTATAAWWSKRDKEKEAVS